MKNLTSLPFPSENPFSKKPKNDRHPTNYNCHLPRENDNTNPSKIYNYIVYRKRIHSDTFSV